MNELVKVKIDGKLHLAKQDGMTYSDFMPLSDKVGKEAFAEYLRRQLKGTLMNMELTQNVSIITTRLDDIQREDLAQVENTLKRAEACALKYLTIQVFDTLLGER